MARNAQQPDWPNEQPVRQPPHRGRIERGRGSAHRGLWNRLRNRYRHRWLHPDAGVLLWNLRPQTHFRGGQHARLHVPHGARNLHDGCGRPDDPLRVGHASHHEDLGWSEGIGGAQAGRKDRPEEVAVLLRHQFRRHQVQSGSLAAAACDDPHGGLLWRFGAGRRREGDPVRIGTHEQDVALLDDPGTGQLQQHARQWKATESVCGVGQKADRKL
uniref:(northern house mosquito) hypothetical protein n=1 Tax=Culex pipiens TaxID=7175 RepID=A0A8D8C333_CULPI